MKNLFLSFTLCLTATLAWSAPSIETDLKNYLQDNELMPQTGDFAGEIIENDEKRTLVFLTPEQKRLYNIDESDIAVANFRHIGKFYIATIPAINMGEYNNLESISPLIEDATFVKASWAGKVRPETASVEVHSEMLFNLKDTAKIELVFNQDEVKFLEKPIALSGAVLSIEAIRSKDSLDAEFMPAGLGYNFAVGHRIYSLAEREIKYSKAKDTTFKSYKLDFSNTISNRGDIRPQDYLFYWGLRMSDLYGRSQTYNLLQNNCTNRLFDILDMALSYNNDKGGKIDFSAINENYISWVNQDLDKVIAFLVKMKAAKAGIEYPAEVQQLIATQGKDLTLNTLDQMAISTGAENNPKNFLYQLPMFIEGHLKARGLIK